MKVYEYLRLLNECKCDAKQVATMPKAKTLPTSTNDALFVDAWLQAAFQRHICSTKEGRIRLVPNAALKPLRPFPTRAVVLSVFTTECYVHGNLSGETCKGKDTQTNDI